MPWKFYTASGQEKQSAFAPTGDVSFGGYRATLLADPTAAQDAATKAYVDVRASQEGTSDFSATAGVYSVPSGSFGTPGWFVPIVVGPSQTWELIGTAGLWTVTATHTVACRMGVRDNTGAALGAAYVFARNPAVTYIPPLGSVTTQSSMVQTRLTTDGTVPPATTIRVVQEFNGGGANVRVERNGTTYQSWGWRRV